MATLIYWQEEGLVGVIRLDAVQSTSPEDVMTITDHPVEQGANVVDHAREEPTRLSIEGVVSTIPNRHVDTDLAVSTIELTAPGLVPGNPQIITLKLPEPPPITPSVGGLIREGVGRISEAISGGPNLDATFAGTPKSGNVTLKAQVLQQREPRNRVRDVYDALRRIQNGRILCQVQIRDREFFDMLIERVAEPRAVGDGSATKFQIDFKRIRISASKTVVAPKPAPDEVRAKPAVNKGAQAAVKDEDPKQRKKTLTKQIVNHYGGVGGFVKVTLGGG
jgi:hypothetical protein